MSLEDVFGVYLGFLSRQLKRRVNNPFSQSNAFTRSVVTFTLVYSYPFKITRDKEAMRNKRLLDAITDWPAVAWSNF